MSVFLWLISLIITLLEVGLSFAVGYLMVLTLAALIAHRKGFPAQSFIGPKTRFAVMVPAHNEERLLPRLLFSLTQMAYPKNLFDIYVVADNCSDRTAQVGREKGAFVFERSNENEIGKGYALNWLLNQVQGTKVGSYDAYVILDADTTVRPQFLTVMNSHLLNGDLVIQGYYAVSDPGQSWSVGLRYAALAVLHYLRPLGRCFLGGGAGLKGNGMCFQADLYHQLRWSGSITEDAELFSILASWEPQPKGIRVAFAPRAYLEAEMPVDLSAARMQNQRWESGRRQVASTFLPILMKKAYKNKSLIALDAAFDFLIPPTSYLIAAILMCLAGGVALGLVGWGWGVALWAVVIFTGMFIYLGAGLLMVHAPRQVWLSLLFTPIYLIWKVSLLIGLTARRARPGWVRTARN